MENKKNTNKFNNTTNKKNMKTLNNKDSKKIVKINDDFKSQNFIYTKKLKNIFIIILLIFLLLIVRLGFLQFVQGGHLKELAYKQQSINQIISPKRGTIYDSTGTKVLATSASVDTITINPEKIEVTDSKEKTQALKEKVAKGLSDIFELDYEETLTKVSSNSQVETIAKKVEQDKVDELKIWMKENKVSIGINIDEDSKRYYPYNTFLSQVLGACGSDNQGLSGIEYEWDSVLSGTPGKIVSSKSASQQEIPNAQETYIPAENGSDITLTIDYNVQTIVEKYLKQAVDTNNIENGGSCIVMNPKTGDILAMATYPNYDLNNPFTPNEYISKTYDSLSSEAKSAAIYKMWSKKSISELYEPGSVFKLITASAALEENITSPNIKNDFNCTGYEVIDGVSIKCWAPHPHGKQTLTNALENSCNPAFMQLGAKIGKETLYKYYKLFGFFDKTDVGLPGEATSIIKKQSEIVNVDRASMSFGQGISITPLQMITAVSAIANDGTLVKPRIVKSITNSDTGAVTTINAEEVRQVISSETASKVKDMMQSVVENGSGGKASVTGYTIGGKTGTSENLLKGGDSGSYVASYAAISPVEDTQLVLLLTLYDPPIHNHNGGTLAGPVVSQMLTEILPCLGIPSDAETNDDSLITVPEIRNKTITEAEKILKEKGFVTQISTSNDKNSTVVVEQMPKPGSTLSKGGLVMLYDQDTQISTTVPDLIGLGKYNATDALKKANLNINIDGTGQLAVSQDPPKGTVIDAGTVVRVIFK